MLFNAEPHDTGFNLPPGAWRVLLDSSTGVADGPPGQAPSGAAAGATEPPAGGLDGAPDVRNPYPLRARSVVLLAGPAVLHPPHPHPHTQD